MVNRNRAGIGLALAAVAIVAAACSSGASPTAAPTESTAPGAPRVEVSLLDSLKMDPAVIAVPAGQPVTFVITNDGATDHEFVVGDEAVQDEHEEMMQGGHGMMGDEPNAVFVGPGETRELTMTFDAAGSTLAGCHLPGHYAAGMKATINIGG